MSEALFTIAGGIIGYISATLVQRRGMARTRASELYKLLGEVMTNNSANNRVKRAREIRSLSSFLGDQIAEST